MNYRDPEMDAQRASRPAVSLPLFDAAAGRGVAGTQERGLACRVTRRQQILEFFSVNLSVHFSSAAVHERFGTATRTRISEINRDPKAKIVIRNKVTVERGREVSVYWGEKKVAQ